MPQFYKRVGGCVVILFGVLFGIYALIGIIDSMVAQSGFDSPTVPIGIGISSLLAIIVGWALVASAND